MASCACYCEELGCEKCCYCGDSFADRGSGLNESIQEIIKERDRYRTALEDITNRGRGVGGAACVTTETLRAIARDALAERVRE